jgi:hypothetical protein
MANIGFASSVTGERKPGVISVRFSFGYVFMFVPSIATNPGASG